MKKGSPECASSLTISSFWTRGQLSRGISRHRPPNVKPISSRKSANRKLMPSMVPSTADSVMWRRAVEKEL